MKKFGFTLAEILTVLVIIGILTAILLPIAFQSSPDENVMKFKKGYNTLGTVIRELVSSDKYYQDGDLGIEAGGEIVDSSTYFCETFADIVSTKSVECSQDSDANYNDVQFVQFGKGEKGDEHGTIEEAKEALDSACKSYAQKIGAEIVTFDGISYYQTAPSIHFGVAWRASLEQNASPEGEEENNANKTLNERAESELNARLFTNHLDENGFYRLYKTFCMDIDEINKGEDPFGFRIRVDGKILTGKRADEWINKSIQNND